ncbi:hypothetical protein [Verrucosispora sp. TAA-831]|uniref:hypothetical protein n=1 Tax=Verrucosispora sp. TAA-831 TaxID=3422227 RepID=UPI003D6E5AD6
MTAAALAWLISAQAPADGPSWVQTLLSILGLVGGAGGIAAVATTLIQRRKVRADAADVLTDTALVLVTPLRERVAELEAEAAGARREVTSTRTEIAQAHSEVGDLRAAVRELTGLLATWRDAVLSTAGTPDPEGALLRLRLMVSDGPRSNGRPG